MMEYKGNVWEILKKTVMDTTQEDANGTEQVKTITWIRPSNFPNKESAHEFKLLTSHLALVCTRYNYGKMNPEAMQIAMNSYNEAKTNLETCENGATKEQLVKEFELAKQEASCFASKEQLRIAITHILSFFEYFRPANDNEEHVVFPTNNDISEIYARSVNYRKDKTTPGEVREGFISDTSCAHSVQELFFLLNKGEHFPKRKMNKSTFSFLCKEAEKERKKKEQEEENKKRTELMKKQEAQDAMDATKKEEEQKKKKESSKKESSKKESSKK